LNRLHHCTSEVARVAAGADAPADHAAGTCTADSLVAGVEMEAQAVAKQAAATAAASNERRRAGSTPERISRIIMKSVCESALSVVMLQSESM
jgi:hypothetical protein